MVTVTEVKNSIWANAMSFLKTKNFFCLCRMVCFFCLSVTVSEVYANEPISFISFPEQNKIAGEYANLSFYILNEDKREIDFPFPKQLELLVMTEDGQTFSVAAVGTNNPETKIIAPKAFAKQDYVFKIPEIQGGKLEVSLVGYEGAKSVLTVRLPEKNDDDSPVAESTEPPEKYPTLENLFTLYQPYVANISAYEPIYFLVGTEPEKSKFQLSFKYRPFNPKGTLSKKYSWLQGIHLGYTQTSFWDLESDSAPFEDTSYKPEIFFLSKNFKSRPDWLKGLFLQAGLQHESNGRGMEFSRSTNYGYLKPYFIYYNPHSRLGFQFSPKLSFYFNNDDETNADFPDYRGYLELETKFGKAESFLLTSSIRPAEEGLSFQVDLSYPISNFVNDNFDLYLQIQYSNALAESLLNYQERTEALRIGFSIVR